MTGSPVISQNSRALTWADRDVTSESRGAVAVIGGGLQISESVFGRSTVHGIAHEICEKSAEPVRSLNHRAVPHILKRCEACVGNRRRQRMTSR
jgi:hypothetical protein